MFIYFFNKTQSKKMNASIEMEKTEEETVTIIIIYDYCLLSLFRLEFRFDGRRKWPFELDN